MVSARIWDSKLFFGGSSWRMGRIEDLMCEWSWQIQNKNNSSKLYEFQDVQGEDCWVHGLSVCRQVGTQKISPLFWAIESGSLEAARAMIKDLLTIRADRDRSGAKNWESKKRGGQEMFFFEVWNQGGWVPNLYNLLYVEILSIDSLSTWRLQACEEDWLEEVSFLGSDTFPQVPSAKSKPANPSKAPRLQKQCTPQTRCQCDEQPEVAGKWCLTRNKGKQSP